MDPLRVLSESAGFFTRGEARDVGYADRDVARCIRSGAWVRFRRGFYTHGDLWADADDVGRHLIRSHAVLRSLGTAVALSHVSAIVEHGIDTWGLDLSRVHVTRLDAGAGRIEGDVVHHEGVCLAGDVLETPVGRVLRPARAVIEACSRATGEVALAHFDNGLHRGCFNQAELVHQFEAMRWWPYVQHLHIPIRMADPRPESIGESRGRWLFWATGQPAPEPQHKVFGEGGELLAVCDWRWRDHGLLGEFDGRVKYGRLLKAGSSAGDVVFAEKQREDMLRELTGLRMIRLIWSDYERPRVTAARLERMLRQAG
jgi:Transcriptional regulator, AbiEi antitoxin